MVEITGHYWDEVTKDHPRYNAIVCTTNMVVKNNGGLVMGAGIAKDFRDRFKDLDLEWGRRIKYGIHDGGFMVTTINSSIGGTRLISLVAFPTKKDWKLDSDLDLIRCSALTLENTATIMGWEHILMTRPGCGCGGLEWDVVKKSISHLDNRFKVIHNGRSN